jgi:hypothetical protein
MGLGDFLFGKSEELKPRDIRPEWQVKQHKKIGTAAEAGALERLRRAGEPYKGRLTAPMSRYEEMGLGALEDYLTSSYASEKPLYQAGRGELEKTLGGEEYDPVGGTYYKAYRGAVMRELKEAKDRLAAKTSARDKYFGGGRIATEGELEESAMGDLALVLGQLFERERERKLGVAPMAMEAARVETEVPARRAQIAQTLGGLPREIEDVGYQREYAEYIRQLTDLGIPLEVATELSLYKPDMYYPMYSHTPGFFGGPSGISAQPKGGYGDAQKVQDTMLAIGTFGASSFLGGGQGITSMASALGSGVPLGGAMTAQGRTGSGGFVFGR